MTVNKPWPERVLGDLGHGFLCVFDTYVLEYTLVSEHPGLCGTRCSSHFEVTYSRDPCGSCSARIQFRIAIFSQSSEREGSQVGVCLDRGLKEQQRQFIIFNFREEGQGQQEGEVSLSVTPTSG